MAAFVLSETVCCLPMAGRMTERAALDGTDLYKDIALGTKYKWVKAVSLSQNRNALPITCF